MISKETFLIQLGIHLRQIRERKNISRQNLADISNVPKSMIGRIDRAEINNTVKTLVKISNDLEI